MRLQQPSFGQLAAIIAILAAFMPLGTAVSQTQPPPPPPIVQPGPPGDAGRRISAEEASNLAGIQYSEADVRFMQGMISHHAQALEMTALLGSRTEREVMRELAQRIELSQRDEIRMMQEWLRARGQQVTALDAHHAHGAQLTAGMLTADQMTLLGQARGLEFDRLFLELMIQHHRGALTMVEELLAQPGAAQDSQLFTFTSDITSDQTMEIDRMDLMLRDLSPDPRVHLKAGFRDAGEAALNLERVATLPKPDGFFDPVAPAGRPSPPEKKKGENKKKAPKPSVETGKKTAEEEEEEEEEDKSRGGILNFANTDLAFSKELVIEGNYHGFNTYNIEDPMTPQLLASVVCPGGQGDVSVYGNLLFMSVEQTRGRLDCGLQGVAEPVEQSPLPRRSHLRHQRHPEAETGGGGADVPRLAHAHAGDRPERQGKHLRLRLGHELRALGGGAAGLLGREPEGRSEHRRSSAST